MFWGWGIRFCHPFSLISSRFCCIENGYFFISIEIQKSIFWKWWIFIKTVIVSYVFWGEEFDNRIHFCLYIIHFALRDHAIFHHIEKFSCPIGQNLAMLGKNRCDFRIPRPRKLRK